MNRFLNTLQPYPFERLRALLQGVAGSADHSPISLSIGEPRHPTPALLIDALRGATDGLAVYPPTLGSASLREAISGWIARRYGIPAPDPGTEVLPVNGSREALFSFAQTVIDPGSGGWVVCPNPFYQIYEGAALLAGARPWFVNQEAGAGFRCDWNAVPDEVWRGCQLLFVCSPANPTGVVMTLEEWRVLFDLSERYGFVIAADECYSEIYFDESSPPLGALEACHRLGRDLSRVVVFSSLSKRSNAPGLRSGFVAGDRGILRNFLLYRTYHGGAMSPTVQSASIAAWNDEAHVRDNRSLYRTKFDSVTPILATTSLAVERPQAGFYLWAKVRDGDDQAFCRRLLALYNVLVLPGSFLAREQGGVNPGKGFVRLALVDSPQACVEAARRIERMLAGDPGQ